MAFLLGLKDAGLSVGARHLLADVTVSCENGTRVGILGPNGAGKTTLLGLLAGTLSPDTGRRIVTDGVRVTSLMQRDMYDASVSVQSVLYGQQEEHDWAGNKTLRDIRQGFVPDIDLQATMGQLSGGQRRRVALAACLGQDAQVVLLDEPTNHLDIEAITWLASYINTRFTGKNAGALCVVTHDRWFLDAICSDIWEVVPGTENTRTGRQHPGYIQHYEGSYAAYILARAERARQQAVAEEKRQNTMRKELAWLRRGAPARTSKPRFRLEAAQALIEDVPPLRDSVELIKTAQSRLGKKVIDLVDVSFTYPDTWRPVLSDITWRIAPGERTGIIGVNAAGKTTLMRVLSGELQPTHGYVTQGKTVVLAVLSQNMSELDDIADKRVVEAVSMIKERLVVGDKELTASQLVERIGFTSQRAWTRVGELSGGERRRLQLVRLLMREPNVLLLDEPTNDLDTDTLAAMEDLLDSFAGTLIIVSHDRYLLERVTDQQMALTAEGQLHLLPGGIEQYLHQRQKFKKNNKAVCDFGVHSDEQQGGKNTHSFSKEYTSYESQASCPESSLTSTQGLRGAKLYQARKQLAKYEKKIKNLEEMIVGCEEKMSVLALSPSAENIAQLAQCDQQHRELVEEKADIEMAWLMLSEEIDSSLA